MALSRGALASGALPRMLVSSSHAQLASWLQTSGAGQQAIASCWCIASRRWLSGGSSQAAESSTETAASSSSSSTSQRQHQQQQQAGSQAEQGQTQQQQQLQQQQQQQQEASSSGAGFDASQAFDGVKQGFESFRQRVGSAGGDGSEPVGERASRFWSSALRDLRDAVLPREERVSLTRAYEGPVYDPGAQGAYDGTTALAAVQVPKTRLEAAMDDLRERFGHHPLFKRLSSANITANPVVKKVGEVAGDLREKYETSDHPAIHRIEDVRERMFAPTDTAAAMQEIRTRDPSFDMARLLAGVKVDAPVVVKAFLTHDLDTLRHHCGPELMERFTGIFAHFQAQGLVEDPTILFVADAELVELRMAEDDPLVVVQFNCQQIKCTRDKFGNVIDGSPSSIQKVFYFWGLQQEKQGVVLPDGRVLPPRWVLKDMMWQSQLMLA